MDGKPPLVQSEVVRAWGLLNPGGMLGSKWWRMEVAIKGPKKECCWSEAASLLPAKVPPTSPLSQWRVKTLNS